MKWEPMVLLTLCNNPFEGSNRAFKDLEKLAAKYDPQPRTKRTSTLLVPGLAALEFVFGSNSP